MRSDTSPDWAAPYLLRQRKTPPWRRRLAETLAFGPALAGLSAVALVLAPGGARAAGAGDYAAGAGDYAATDYAATDYAAALDASPGGPGAAADPAGSSGFPASPGASGGSGGWWSLHAQATFTAQGVTGFHSPYAGPESLKPNDLEETADVTLYAGVRPWQGAEIWINPEVDQGFGIGNTLGVAGYTSGEAYKVGKANPYVQFQRLFIRQTFALGGDTSSVTSAANQMAGSQSANRLVVTAGKFGAPDVFDTNRYAHDPRGDFMNWAMISSGSFDYASDAWGYSVGASAEWYQGVWTLRGGLFNFPRDFNGPVLGANFAQQQAIGEVEHRHAIGGHAGAVRLGVWRSHLSEGSFADAIAWGLANATAPDVTQVRRWHTRWGGYINAEQELTPALGAFVRASTADGRYADYDFTDIDTAVSGGLVLSGAVWHLPADSAGLAFAVNAASRQMKAYLAAGGLGILAGDGQLSRPGLEKIVEANYSWRPSGAVLGGAVVVTVDYQLVVNPAYNRDRGPAHVLGVRVHVAG